MYYQFAYCVFFILTATNSEQDTSLKINPIDVDADSTVHNTNSSDDLQETDVPDPAIKSIIELYKNGRMQIALARAQELLERSDSSPQTVAFVDWLRFFVFFKQKKFEFAQAILQEKLKTQNEDGIWLDFFQLKIYALLSDCTKAKALLTEIPTQSAFTKPGIFRVAQCWLNSGNYLQAETLLEKLAQQAETDIDRLQVLYLRGRVAESQGHIKEAHSIYQNLAIQYPIRLLDNQAKQHVLGFLNSHGAKAVTVDDFLMRARLEKKYYRFSQARRFFQLVKAKGRRQELPAAWQSAELGLAEIDLMEKKYPRALRRLKRIYGQGTNAVLQAQALFLQRDIYVRKGLVHLAHDITILMIRHFPGSSYTAEAVWAAARLAYDRGKFPQARELIEKLLAMSVSQTPIGLISTDGLQQISTALAPIKDRAFWLLAWIEKREGSVPETIDSYLSKIDYPGRLSDSVLYWRIQFALKRGLTSEAQIWTTLLEAQSPTSYYSFAAINALRDQDHTFQLKHRFSLSSSSQTNPLYVASQQAVDLRGLLRLYAWGLRREVKAILKESVAYPMTLPDTLLAAWLYQQYGEYFRSYKMTRSIQLNTLGPEKGELLKISYPRPFLELVASAAVEFNIPEALIYAVIKQESAFNPRATSPRKARGLMQMIQPTAKRMAREMALKRFHLGQLYRPKIAIRLGAQYLAFLLDWFDGNIAAVVAAYHAGEHTVDKWIVRKGRHAFDEFIEEIPFSTTRKYVKKVISSFFMYHHLYYLETEQEPQLSKPENTEITQIDCPSPVLNAQDCVARTH